MSTTTVSYSSTTQAVSLEDLRLQEQQAREATLRRLGAAKNTIQALHERYKKLVTQLDARRRHLPDLDYVVPVLANPPSSEDPADFEQFGRNLEKLLENYEQQAQTAIEHAGLQLERRKQLAAAWQQIHDITAEIAVRNQACKVLAKQLNEQFQASTAAILDKTATLADAQIHLKLIGGVLFNLKTQHDSLSTRLNTLKIARSLAGDMVTAVSSTARMTAYEGEQLRKAQSEIKTATQAALTASHLAYEQLPTALQLRIEFESEFPQSDSGRQLADQIQRHRTRLDNICNAERMIATPPRYADDSTGTMASRWSNLVQRLQAVVCGFDEFSSSLELEFGQIDEDCQRAISRAYAKANFLAAAADKNFEVADGDNGLILMDLTDYPGYSIEVENQQDEQGFFAVMRLVADPDIAGNVADDSAVTEAACRKIQALANESDTGIVSEVRELERKATVTRKRRPTQPLARAAQLN